jgi:hypothetical protein
MARSKLGILRSEPGKTLRYLKGGGAKKAKALPFGRKLTGQRPQFKAHGKTAGVGGKITIRRSATKFAS